MSRRKCDACGRMANKHKRRQVLSPDGTMAAGLVCNPCAFGRCIQIVPLSRETPCAMCPPGSKANAEICPGCLNRVARLSIVAAFKPYVEKLRKLAKTYKHDANPLHEGLMMAADILSTMGAVNVQADGPAEPAESAS